MGRWRDDGRDGEDLERVSKIRKKSQKKTHAADLSQTFEKPRDQWELEGGAFAARVVEVHKRYCFVSPEPEPGRIETRDVWLAEVARKYRVAARKERNFVAVGDQVLCHPDETREVEKETDLPQGVIQHAAPRSAKIARLDPHDPALTHVIAANMDTVLIVASYLSPTIKWGLIDRYLVLAESEHLRAIIILNKRDLLAAEADSEFAQDCRSKEDLYRSLGYPVFSVQANAPKAKRNADINAIRDLLKGRISLLSGHSGVGKSSLLNLFKPEIEQLVEPDEDIFYKGRHTTSFASFIKLGTGGYLIDTPGIRSFTFEEKGAVELSHCFVELRPLLGQCHYRECRHLDEPACAVRDGVEAGTISRWRYRSYLGILLGATGREGRLRDLPMDE